MRLDPEPSNPKTEPMPIPVWDEDDQRPWNAPPDRPTPPGPGSALPGPSPLRPGAAPPSLGATPPSGQGAAPPGGQGTAPSGGQGTAPSGPNNDTQRLDTSWGDPAPAGSESRPGVPWGAPAEPEAAKTPWGSPAEPPQAPWWGGPASQGTEPPRGDAPWAAASPPDAEPSQRPVGPWGAPAEPSMTPWGAPAEAEPPKTPWDAAPPPGGEPPRNTGEPPRNDPWGSPASPGSELATRAWGSGPPPSTEPAGWNDGAVPAPDTRTEKSRKTPLLIGGIVAAVVLGVGVVWALTQGVSGSNAGADSPSATPAAGDAARQAAAVNDILKSGSTARAHLPGRLRTCDDVSAGVAGFQRVVQDRQQELSRAKGIKVDQLQNGARLRKSMVAAYQHSLDADRAYLAWAREIQARNCGGKIAPLTPRYKNAITANDKAGPAKRQVVNLWKPIANTHGLPTYVWNRL